MAAPKRKLRLGVLTAILSVSAVVTTWWIIAVFAVAWPFSGRLAWRFTPAWSALVAAFILAATLVVLHLMIQSALRTPGRPTPEELAGATAEERAVRIRNFRRSGLKGLIVGSDGRTSTSQLQVAIWTVAIAFGLLMLIIVGRTPNCPVPPGIAHRGDCPADPMSGTSFASLLGRDFRWEYLFLLGWPLALAITAKRQVVKALDQVDSAQPADGTRVNAGTPAAVEAQGEAQAKTPPPDPDEIGWLAGLRQAISDDQNRAAILDAQYFLFTLITVAYFLLQLITHPASGLPEIPATLIVLMGISGSGYLSGKIFDPLDLKSSRAVVPPAPETSAVIGPAPSPAPATPSTPPTDRATPSPDPGRHP